MQVSCPALSNSITIELPRDTPSDSLAPNLAPLSEKAVVPVSMQAARESQRHGKSLPSSLQPTPVKAQKGARPSSGGPLGSMGRCDSDAESTAGSLVSQSGEASWHSPGRTHCHHGTHMTCILIGSERMACKAHSACTMQSMLDSCKRDMLCCQNFREISPRCRRQLHKPGQPGAPEPCLVAGQAIC